MPFYFTLPQTLIRYFATDASKSEKNLIFLPEGKLSNTGRDNFANFKISKQIISVIAPHVKLEYWNNSLTAPNLNLNDGIGNEILRGQPTYPWNIHGEIDYIVQHSALGYEGVNLKILISPQFLFRAFKRVQKYYNGIKFKRFLMYCGINEIQLFFVSRPWHKIQIIKHVNLFKVCEELKIIVPEYHQILKKNNSKTNGNLLLMATGDYSNELKKIKENTLLSQLTVYIKSHPQQSSRLINDFELKNLTFLSNKSIPIELYICILRPKIVIGPKSSVHLLCQVPYIEYCPLDWPIESEANLIDKFRRIIHN